jgi:serine/threonine-protein kinase PknG
MAQCNATPGCTGQIADGFCDQCGSAPLPAPKGAAAGAIINPAASRSVPTPAPVAAATVTATASTACSCGGSFVDGFCDQCGNAAPATPANPGSHRSHKTGSTTLSGRTGGSRRQSQGTRVSGSRKFLGLGMVNVPDIPKGDPRKALMAEAKVPDNKRFCSGYLPDGNPCETPLTKREKGFCPKCRTAYNFVPGLATGELVAGQYKVEGCIAFGGMGWIYLATDVTLNRVCVLKGLVNQADASLAAAAVAERQFLAEVKHPNIVSVYTCVQHANARGNAAYTVMEYVGGRTLKSLRKERGPLPVSEVLAYMHRVLGAFGYLHANGLIYNDFKPDNVMLEDGDIKVIDLGGVCRMTAADGDIYSTVGYCAPEIAKDGPSISSDLYTIGRTIAVLVTEFKGYQSSYQYKLRTPADEPVYAKYDSLYRFLAKACHDNPNMRFQSAEEMAEQLVGVMKDAVAIDTGEQHNAESPVFGPDTLALRDVSTGGVDVLDIESLPALKMSPQDPASSFIIGNLGTNDPKRQTPVIQQALDQFPDSVEARLAMARNQMRLGNHAEAEKYLATVEAQDPFEWRVIWYRGMALAAQGDYENAAIAFNTCYSEVPGELAPKLAIAVVAEMAGDSARAIEFYGAVLRTNSNFATAAFGLARCLAKTGKRNEAVEALARVPQASSLYIDAQKAIARILIQDRPAAPSSKDLAKAAQTLEALVLQGTERALLHRDFFGTTLRLLERRTIQPEPSVLLMGQALDERPVRLALERTLRDLAKLSTNPAEKVALVDQANAIRPRTVV